MQKLDSAQIAQALTSLAQWRLDADQGAITRDYQFADFAQAFGFMAQVAIASEKRNHHPEWFNVYNKVRITWTTHDVHGLSSNDVGMATLCDQAFAAISGAAE
jgi:4a-hydroxytetrahydrobiopterin dehydratase